MLKCNLIIPGYRKSGTSSLHEYLALHPDICMSNPTETNFFSITASWQKGDDWYNSLFQDEAQPRRWYGESSVGYCIWEPALQRIKRCLHRPRFIVLLRDPLQRLLSHYKWHWALGIESRPLLKAVQEEEKKGHHPDFPPPHQYVTCYRRDSRYSYFCPVMESMFGKENVLYLNSDELLKNPQSALNRCFRFLGLKEHPIAREIRENMTDRTLIQRTFGLKTVLKPIPSSFRDRIDPDFRIRRRIRTLLGKKKRPPPNIAVEEIEELSWMLKEDIFFYESVFAKQQENSTVSRAN
jgi:Sulfotransferase domain